MNETYLPRWSQAPGDLEAEVCAEAGEGGCGGWLLTLSLGEDGDAERPDVEEAEPDGGEAEGTDQHQPPPQRRHALLPPLRRHACPVSAKHSCSGRSVARSAI